jgi:hypothetical protein
MWLGPGGGAMCDACRREIPVAEVECEAVFANGQQLRLDGQCYKLLLEEHRVGHPTASSVRTNGAMSRI